MTRRNLELLLLCIAAPIVIVLFGMMVVNGVPNVRTCITPVEDGMTVDTQDGYGTKEDKA